MLNDKRTQDGDASLQTRSVTEILNETFVVYTKNLWRFVWIMAIVQLPMSILGLIPDSGVAVFFVLLSVRHFATMCAYSATVYAVGQQYVTGTIGLRACYSRVWLRVVSVLALTAVMAASAGLGLYLMVLVVPVFAAIVFMAYVSTGVQAVIVEGMRPLEAVRRSIDLVRGSWWRVFGSLTVIFLAAMGLGLLVFSPFFFAALGAGDGNAASATLEYAGTLVVGVAVSPVVFIAVTLLYYDLRIRKEDFNMATLASEMRLART